MTDGGLVVEATIEGGELDTKPAERIRRRRTNRMPMEGDNGLYSQSFPLALSTDVKIGERIGRDFLGGRVVIFRGDNGLARVMSAYCPHVGADLSAGTVGGNNLQYAFHKWGWPSSPASPVHDPENMWCSRPCL